LRDLVERAVEERCDALVSLGDLCYLPRDPHGRRFLRSAGPLLRRAGLQLLLVDGSLRVEQRASVDGVGVHTHEFPLHDVAPDRVRSDEGIGRRDRPGLVQRLASQQVCGFERSRRRLPAAAQHDSVGVVEPVDELLVLGLEVGVRRTSSTAAGRFPTETKRWLSTRPEQLFASDALLLGRATYDEFAAAWPSRSGDAFADKLNSMPKYVASTTLTEPLDWNATLLAGDVVQEVRKLKEQPGQDLLIYASGELVRTLMQNGR
jgi:hypothetical protein